MRTVRKRNYNLLLLCLLHIIWFGAILQSGAEALSGVRETSSSAAGASSLPSQLWVPRKQSDSTLLSRRNYFKGRVSLFASSSTERSDSVPSEVLLAVPKEGDSSDRNLEMYTSLGILISSLACLCIAAKTGFLPGTIEAATGLPGVYTNAMILQDSGSTIFSAILAFFLIKIIGLGNEKGWYNSKISRKLTHTLSAPFFVLVYPLFSAAEGARFFAVVVTVTNAARLYLSAIGKGDDSLARSVSRSGDKSEALGGPFIYACQLSLLILAFWRSSLIGVVATSTLAAGDGMADLVGRRWGRTNKWWFSDQKSIAGTTAFAISASLTSIGLVQWLEYTGCLHSAMNPADLAFRIVGISVVCALVELLPVVDDNYSVPLSAVALAAIFLQ